MINLVISIYVLASFFGGAVGVRCHLGTDNTTIVAECGRLSDKCVEAKIVGGIAKVCYNQMDWVKYPKFIPRLGCQNYTEYGTSAEICICIGDMCNDGHFKSLETSVTNSPAANNTEDAASGKRSIPESTMPPHLVISIHQTSTAKLIQEQIENFTEAETVSASCYVGVGTATVIMQCASGKCVTSRLNDQVAKVCYDQVPWSRYPAFDRRVGCQSYQSAGTVAEVCICVGDKCNEGDFETMSSHTTTESTDATTGDSVDVTTDDSMEATYAFIDTTALDGNVIEEEDPDIPVAESFPNTTSGVHCYVGTGATKILMDCGSSSDKCVKTRLNYLVARVCYSQMDWARFSSFSPMVGCQSFNEFGMDTEICICTGDKCNDGGFEELDRPAPEVYPTETDLPEYGSGTIGDTPPATTAANVVVDVHRTMAATVFSQWDTTLSTTTSTKPDKPLHCYVGPGAPTFLFDCGTSSDKCGMSKVHGSVARFCYNQVEWDHYPTFTPKIGCQSFIASNTTICICVGDKCNDGDFEQEYTSTQTMTTKVTAPKSTKETTTAATLEIVEIGSDLDTNETQDIKDYEYESTTSVVHFSTDEETVTTDMPETTEVDSDSETTEMQIIELEVFQDTTPTSVEEISTEVPETTEVDTDSYTTDTQTIEVEVFQATTPTSVEEISTDVPEATEVDTDSYITETQTIEGEVFQATTSISIEEISTEVPETAEADTDSYTTEKRNIEDPTTLKSHSPKSKEKTSASAGRQDTQKDRKLEATEKLPLEEEVYDTTISIAHSPKSTDDTTISARAQTSNEDQSVTAKSQASTTRKSGKFAVAVDGSDTTTKTTTSVAATTNEEKPIISTTSGTHPMCASIILMLLVTGISCYVL